MFQNLTKISEKLLDRKAKTDHVLYDADLPKIDPLRIVKSTFERPNGAEWTNQNSSLV
jgi:hypothetical protein